MGLSAMQNHLSTPSKDQIKFQGLFFTSTAWLSLRIRSFSNIYIFLQSSSNLTIFLMCWIWKKIDCDQKLILLKINITIRWFQSVPNFSFNCNSRAQCRLKQLRDSKNLLKNWKIVLPQAWIISLKNLTILGIQTKNKYK